MSGTPGIPVIHDQEDVKTRPDLLDVYHGDPLMAPAFVAMVCWALGEPDMRAAYESETGAVLPAPSRSPIDVMIDATTGVVDAYVMGFAEWAYTALWGSDDGEEDDLCPE